MRAKFLAIAPYIAALGIDFYLLPLFAKDTGAAILLLLCIMPTVAFVTAAVHGVRSGFNPLLPVAAFLLFLPTLFIYYNPSAWVYAIFYALTALAGLCIGRAFRGKR